MSASPSTTSTGKSPELRRSGSRNRHDSVKISVSYPSSDQINDLPSSCLSKPNEKTHLTPSIRRASLSSPRKTTFSVSPPRRSFVDLSPKRGSQPKNDVMFSVHYTNKNGREITENVVSRTPRESNCYLRVSSSGNRSHSIDSTNSGYDEDANSSRRNSTRSQGTDESIGGGQKDLSPSPTFEDHHGKQKVVKMGKRNIKAQVKRFRMETKAAKTLAIIVGGFILCWMPFFTIYLIRAFCTDCINQTIFSVLFWLGYCNSAINPCIYALFSKDFRFAFKRVIYRILCGKKLMFNANTKRRGSDASYMKTTQRNPSNNLSMNHKSNHVGDDSDPGASDSR